VHTPGYEQAAWPGCMVGSGTVQTWDKSARSGPSSVSGGNPVRSAFGRAGALLAELFPESPQPLSENPQPPTENTEPGEKAPARRRWLIAVGYVVAICAGAALMLARYVGTAPWRSIYAEDLPVYLVEALAHPWHSMFTAYAGYLQLVPRVIGQFVSIMPLRDAAVGFAVSGALIAAACALFIFRACAGHVRSPVMRALVALSVLLLPVALIQIADSGVNTPWYLEMALFWALLWRPRGKAGAATAALIGFAAVSSNITATVFVVLVLARIIALPRVREHAVTAGWLAGCLLQLPYFLQSGSSSNSRLQKLATPGQSVSFFGHDVVLPAFGWHASWVVRHWWDRNYALLLVGGLLVIIVACILVTGSRRVRVFTVTSLVFGFLFTVFAATIEWWVTINGVTPDAEPGARYTCLPILLITWVLVVAVDAALMTRGMPVAVLAAVGLTAVLCIGWIPDFRYTAPRNQAGPWVHIADQWLDTCQRQDAVHYWDSYDNKVTLVIPCSRIRR
jgi:hypothetical protein